MVRDTNPPIYFVLCSMKTLPTLPIITLELFVKNVLIPHPTEQDKSYTTGSQGRNSHLIVILPKTYRDLETYPGRTNSSWTPIHSCKGVHSY